jgi:hypothetical protein
MTLVAVVVLDAARVWWKTLRGPGAAVAGEVVEA